MREIFTGDEFTIENEIEDGLIRLGYKYANSDNEIRYANYIIEAGNNEPILECSQPDGFSSRQACEANANLVVARNEYERIVAVKADLYEALTSFLEAAPPNDRASVMQIDEYWGAVSKARAALAKADT